MLELQLARKYLIPSKKKLSASLISLLSCLVISLVIWLLLIFLSVTEGIEKNWLKKMTTLNSPIRITPTQNYYNSYYYQIDKISLDSLYRFKTLKEKLLSDKTDPYDPKVDEQIPPYWPVALKNSLGEPLDLVKTAFHALSKMDLKAEDYEISTAMLRLQLLRKRGYTIDESFISQASYLTTFSEKDTNLKELILPPDVKDLSQFLYLASLSPSFHEEAFETTIKRILCNISHVKFTLDPMKFSFDPSMLPKETSFIAFAKIEEGKVERLILPLTEKERGVEGYGKGKLIISKEGNLTFKNASSQEFSLSSSAFLFLKDSPLLQGEISPSMLEGVTSLSTVFLPAHFFLQGKKIEGTFPLENLLINEAKVKSAFSSPPLYEPLWPYTLKEEIHIPSDFQGASAVIVPKALKNSGVKLGDKGSLNFAAFTGTTSQEMKQPIFVSAFYDPGAMSIGSRYILAKDDVVSLIASSNSVGALDPMMASGIKVFVNDLSETPRIAKEIRSSFEKLGISSYFNVIPYYEFEFARDLILQLQSDRYLFTLIGIIILVVASSNILSLLFLLVNDKKKEIGILKAMGASTKSIALIFALSGLFLGMISFGIGLATAYFTLHNIDSLVHFLSALQGHEAFNPDIYGNHLPNELSRRVLITMAIATPIVSLIAASFPAIKAARLNPSDILRNEG